MWLDNTTWKWQAQLEKVTAQSYAGLCELKFHYIQWGLLSGKYLLDCRLSKYLLINVCHYSYLCLGLFGTQSSSRYMYVKIWAITYLVSKLKPVFLFPPLQCLLSWGNALCSLHLCYWKSPKEDKYKGNKINEAVSCKALCINLYHTEKYTPL